MSDEDKELEVNKDEDFIGEFEKMNVNALKDDSYLVAICQGDREKGKFMSSTVRGPYDYFEMIEEVGYMWQEEQHHAKVVIVNQDRDTPNKFLDTNTTDYIEANWQDLAAEILLQDDDVEYTCRAGINENDANEDPRTAASAEDKDEDEHA